MPHLKDMVRCLGRRRLLVCEEGGNVKLEIFMHFSEGTHSEKLEILARPVMTRPEAARLRDQLNDVLLRRK